jgi:hypothetical protein
MAFIDVGGEPSRKTVDHEMEGHEIGNVPVLCKSGESDTDEALCLCINNLKASS